MSVDRAKPELRVVWDRGKPVDHQPAVEKANDVARPASSVEHPTPELPTSRVTWQPREDAPANGGLHQLTLAGLEPPRSSARIDPLDFSQYQPGMNNRGLLAPIAKDLDELFGVRMQFGYSARLEAFPRMVQQTGIGFTTHRNTDYTIGERAIDKLVEPFADSEHKRAVATFAIAHEFFHALLRHADLVNWGTEKPRGFRVKDYGRYEKLFELQADYLATKYLILRGLPVDPVMTMFETGDFEETKAYPSGPARANNVRRALEPGFDVALFQNDIVDCLQFLDFIAMKS